MLSDISHLHSSREHSLPTRHFVIPAVLLHLQPGFISEWINKESEKLMIFMRGLMTRWTCIQ